MVNKTTYRDLLLPEHFNLINTSANQKIAVPIFFAQRDLTQLFSMSVHDRAPHTAQSFNIEDAPIDPELLSAFADKPKSATSSVFSDNALVMGFSILGYASSLGRHIEAAHASVNPDNTLNHKNGGHGELSSDFFASHENNPLKGAQLLFENIQTLTKNPQRAALIGFISPPPLIVTKITLY